MSLVLAGPTRERDGRSALPAAGRGWCQTASGRAGSPDPTAWAASSCVWEGDRGLPPAPRPSC